MTAPPTHSTLDASSTSDTLSFLLEAMARKAALGDDERRPDQLEVHHIWQDCHLDTRHFRARRAVTVGSVTARRWRLLGVDMGWVPAAVGAAIPLMLPGLTDVETAFKSDFVATEDLLGTVQRDLFEPARGAYQAVLDPGWDAFVDMGDERLSPAQLVERGLAFESADGIRVPLQRGMRLAVEIGDNILLAHMVAPSQRPVGVLGLDWGFASALTVAGGLAMAFGAILAFAPDPPETTFVEVEDRFFVSVLQHEKKPEVKQPTPETNPDAGAGDKPKGDEGKIGKRDAVERKTRGDRARAISDRQIAEDAGALAFLRSQHGQTFGPDIAVARHLGTLTGKTGTQIGVGGLGERGDGFGGGGRHEGLGGWSDHGPGTGRSGEYEGGGDFGPKKSGGLDGVAGGDPILVGSLDKAQVDEVVKRHMNAIRYCYVRELPRDPSLNGKVVVKFIIAKDGTVSSAQVKSSTLGNAAVESCVSSRFFRMKFPKPRGGIVIVSYPFMFSPK